MKKIIMMFFAAAMPAVAALCATFTSEVPFGNGTVTMTFKITSDDPDAKECQVGIGQYGSPAIATSSAGELIIPSEAGGYVVTSIGDWAFYQCKGLTSVTIPEGVTNIDVGAFMECYGLTSITIPESVTSIGDGAFSECTSLTSITIPGYVTSIDEGAFSGCTALEYVDILKAKYWDFSRGSQINSGALIFLHESNAGSITDDYNVVTVGSDGIGTADEIKLSYQWNFNTPYIINANTVTTHYYGEWSSGDANTLCLPYDLTVPKGMTAYEPSDESDGETLVFKEVEGGELKAYKPYLVMGESRDLNATNVTIGVTPAEPEAVEVGDYKLYGTTRRVDNATAAAMGAYILQVENTWKPVSTENTNAYVMPGHAYLVPSSDVSGAKEIKTVFANEATGIETIKTVDRDGTTRMYDLNGRRIDGKPNGIYIVNGKKYSPTK